MLEISCRGSFVKLVFLFVFVLYITNTSYLAIFSIVFIVGKKDCFGGETGPRFSKVILTFFQLSPRVYKTFSYSTPLSTKFIMLINIKTPCWHFNIYQHDKIQRLRGLKQETILVFMSS